MTTDNPRTLLVVDDALANRALLRKIFESDYHVVEATDGGGALSLLRTNPLGICCVLLDLVMPRIDGYTVLKRMQDDGELSKVPVIVVTAGDNPIDEVRVLDMGAADIITKPFNASILRSRVRNAIARADLYRVSEQNRSYEASLREQDLRIKRLRIDERTGLLDAKGFYERAKDIIGGNPDTRFCIVRCDIDRFKIFNDVYGIQEGNRLLGTLGDLFKRRNPSPITAYGHMEADNFAACVPEGTFDSEATFNEAAGWLHAFQPDFNFMPRLGIFVVDDPNLEIELMCDRAQLALRSTKGDFKRHFAYYDDSMRQGLIHEQEVVGEMHGALEEGQFQVYLQPQYNYVSGEMIGAEVLSRWIHPDKGVIQPDDFIPILERNGFITHLDEHVWEQACKLLRSWRDRGLPDLPISVNISRYDCYNPHLCDIITKLAETYDIPRDLLHLEITESAYMSDPAELTRIVSDLEGRGFEVEMDDFGSGYSSLNTLKDVHFSAIKLDKAFVSQGQAVERGGIILSSIVRMAHRLKTPVVAEGVETVEQADYLKSIGCVRLQGYLFSKPVPVDEFERLDRTLPGRPGLLADHKADDIDGAFQFFDASTQSTLLFNSFVGGAAIIEYEGEESSDGIESLRANDKYFEAMGIDREEYEARGQDLLDLFDEKGREAFMGMVREAMRTGEEDSCEVQMRQTTPESPKTWLHLRTRFLASYLSQNIFYLSVENVTAQTQLLIHNTSLSNRLSNIMSSLPGGIVFFRTDGTTTYKDYFSPSCASLYGYDPEEFALLFSKDTTRSVHPDDKAEFRDFIRRCIEEPGRLHNTRCRHVLKQGGWMWTQMTGRVTGLEDGVYHICCIALDADAAVHAEQTMHEQNDRISSQRAFLKSIYDSVPCGIIEIRPNGSRVDLLSCNHAAWSICGFDSATSFMASFRDKERFARLMGGDAALVLSNTTRAFDGGETITFDHRVITPSGESRWVHDQMQRTTSVDGSAVTQCVFTDVTSLRRSEMGEYATRLLDSMDDILEYDQESGQATVYKKMSERGVPGERLDLRSILPAWIDNHVHPDDVALVSDLCGEATSGGLHGTRSVTFRVITPDGSVRLASTTAVHFHETHTVLFFSRDITDDDAETTATPRTDAPMGADDLSRSSAVRSFAERLLLLSLQMNDVEDLIHATLEMAGKQLGLTRAWVAETLPAGDSLLNLVEWRDPAQAKSIRSLRTVARQGDLAQQFRTIASGGETIVCEDAAQAPEVARETLRSQGIKACVVFPLNRTSSQSGCVGFDESRSTRAWTDDEVDVLGYVTTCIGIMLGRKDDVDEELSLSDEQIDIIDSSPTFAYVIDPDTHRILYCNQTVKRRCGSFQGELCYRSCLGRTTPCDVCPVSALKRTGVSEAVIVHDDVASADHLMQASYVSWLGVRACLVTGIDASRPTEDASVAGMPEFERKLRAFAATIFSAYQDVLDFDFNSHTCTTLASRYFSHEKGQQISDEDGLHGWLMWVADEKDRRSILDAMGLGRADESTDAPSETRQVEYLMRMRGGNEVWCRTTFFRVDEGHYLCCFQDVTSEREAERTLDENRQLRFEAEDREKYRIVLDQTDIAVVEWNHGTGAFSFSPSFKRYAFSDEGADASAPSPVHPDDQRQLEEFLESDRKDERHSSVTLRLLMTDGTFRWTRMERTTIVDADGHPTRTIGTFMDVDEEARAKGELEESNHRLRDIVRNVPMGVAIYEIRDKVYPLYVSDAGVRMFGFTREEYDRRIADGDPVFFSPDIADVEATMVSGDTSPTCHRLHATRKDGTTFWLDVYAHITRREGKPPLAYVTLIDVSDEVAREKREDWQLVRYRLLSETSDIITYDYSVNDDLLTIDFMHSEIGRASCRERV